MTKWCWGGVVSTDDDAHDVVLGLREHGPDGLSQGNFPETLKTQSL